MGNSIVINGDSSSPFFYVAHLYVLNFFCKLFCISEFFFYLHLLFNPNHFFFMNQLPTLFDALSPSYWTAFCENAHRVHGDYAMTVIERMERNLTALQYEHQIPSHVIIDLVLCEAFSRFVDAQIMEQNRTSQIQRNLIDWNFMANQSYLVYRTLFMPDDERIAAWRNIHNLGTYFVKRYDFNPTEIENQNAH